MDNESCDVGLQKDDRYVWRLRVKGDCKKVLDDIRRDLGKSGRRYFEDRLIFEPDEKAKSSSGVKNTDEN